MIKRETLIGILVTILFHLIVAMIIVTIRIHNFKQDKETRFEMNIASEVVDRPEDKQKTEEVNKEVLEQIYKEMEKQTYKDRGNIGVNTSEKVKEDISTEKYIQRIQNEMGLKNIKVGGQGDQQQTKVLEDLTQDSKEDNSIRSLRQNAPIKGKRVVYKGPTNIYYDLEGRHDVNMIVPVYKCEGSGRVVIDIVVNQTGAVMNASINRQSSTTDECFLNAAYKAASGSRFNSDPKAPLQQKGTITYQFVAQ